MQYFVEPTASCLSCCCSCCCCFLIYCLLTMFFIYTGTKLFLTAPHLSGVVSYCNTNNPITIGYTSGKLCCLQDTVRIEILHDYIYYIISSRCTSANCIVPQNDKIKTVTPSLLMSSHLITWHSDTPYFVLYVRVCHKD